MSSIGLQLPEGTLIRDSCPRFGPCIHQEHQGEFWLHWWSNGPALSLKEPERLALGEWLHGLSTGQASSETCTRALVQLERQKCLPRTRALAMETERFAHQFRREEQPGVEGFLAKNRAPYSPCRELIRACEELELWLASLPHS